MTDLAADTSMTIDTTTKPDVQWVTVKSADRTVSMDVPAAWMYISFGNARGGSSFGAVEGTMSAFGQRVIHGTRTDTVDQALAENTKEVVEEFGCTAAEVRPYEDTRFVGKGRSFPCPDGTSWVTFVVDGKGDISSYKGYFFFQLSDAVGVSALQRAILSLEVS